jgi:hypothetical protein
MRLVGGAPSGAVAAEDIRHLELWTRHCRVSVRRCRCQVQVFERALDLPDQVCRFHTRCPHAEACCAVEPLLASDATVEGHYTACHMLVPGSGHSAAPRIAA